MVVRIAEQKWMEREINQMNKKMTNNEIIKALECCKSRECPECSRLHNVLSEEHECRLDLMEKVYNLINRLNERDKKNERIIELSDKTIKVQSAEIERLQKSLNNMTDALVKTDEACRKAESEAIKDFTDKIAEVFSKYEYLHSCADSYRKDYILSSDGTKIEIQSVWDILSLKKHKMDGISAMDRLQKNIETIAQERLLTKLERDFKLFVIEMVGDDK